jgi:hypothetical protein
MHVKPQTKALKERDQLGDPRVDGKILNQNLKMHAI